MSKQYGLIIPKKGHEIGEMVKKPSIFEDDSESENEFKKPTGLKSLTKSLKREDRLIQVKAIEEDPTVYQYDEIYDVMEEKKLETKLANKDIERKPKYINKLLVTASKRKRENERRLERQVQREREAEGSEFADKESFVTPSYKKKLEELKALDEEEAREEYLESIGDVKKQGNLDGFYRHLYEQKVTYADKESSKTINDTITENIEKPVSIINRTASDEKSSPPDIKDSSDFKTSKRQRNYRKRDNTENSDDDKIGEQDTQIYSNIDADSDFSIDSDSDADDENSNNSNKDSIRNESAQSKENFVKNENELDLKTSIYENSKLESMNKETSIIVANSKESSKPKIDVWKKRTVGEVFDEALKRYFERKALRESR